MAFNNVRNIDLSGGISMIFGDYTQTRGNASQTYAIAGGRIIGVIVNPQVTAEDVDMNNGLYSVSISGAINTLTIYGNSSVTAGTFLVIVNKGG